MDIELRELSAIYLQNLQEDMESGGQDGGADVGAHAKAIRYQSRRDGVPLPKAFNDYVAKNQLSGTERTALRQKLGFMGEETEVLDEKKECNHSPKGEDCPIHGKEKECSMKEEDNYKTKDKILNKAKPLHKHLYKNLHKKDTDGDVNEHVSWRTDLSEYVGGNASPKGKTDTKSGEKISEKKVKNKVIINPPMGMTEAIAELGGQILEMIEVEEAVYGGTPKKKEEPKDTRMTVTNADKKGNTPAYQKMMSGDKRYKKADHMGEDASMSPQELQLQKKKAMIDRMIAQKRQQGLSKVKKSEAPTKAMGESTEDSLKDRRMERGGVDGNNRYNSATKNVAMGGGKKKPYDGMSALEKVKASIRAKHGQGAIIDTKKK
tara:strand:+ start:5889 stop:7019 length:1131 start_codon:yes stop_codon:yes gene_type:complete